jgi:3-oxoadipate enol-lactonase
MPLIRVEPPGGRPLQMYYEEHGSGEPLLLIRGLGRSCRYWEPALPAFSSHFRTIVFDNRGVGRTDSPLGLYTTQQMAADAAGLLAAIGLERAHVYGVSLGGMIAQEFALRHRARVRRLVLASTRSGGRHSLPTPKSSLAQLARGATLPLNEANQIQAELTLTADFVAANPQIVESWNRWAAADPNRKRGQIGQVSAATRHDAWDRLPHLKPQTLVVTGDLDLMIPAENSDLLAGRIPDARLRILRGGAHDLSTERPEDLVDLVRDFLERA